MEEATEYDEGCLAQAIADAEELSRLEEEARVVMMRLRGWQLKYESCRSLLITSSILNLLMIWYFIWRRFHA